MPDDNISHNIIMIKTHKLFLLITLISTTGCNGDVFVDDFLPRGHEEITLSENDNTKEINFKSDNWSLYKIVCETDEYLIANAYTLDGEPTYLPFDEKELGTVQFTNDYIDFYVEKKRGNKLKVTLNENLHNENVELLIIVGNEYKEEYINLLLGGLPFNRIFGGKWGGFQLVQECPHFFNPFL